MTTEAIFDLVEIDTADGTFRFFPGQDGDFVDSLGRTWVGSSLLAVDEIASSVDFVSQSVRLTFSYFQSDNDPDPIAQMKALGSDYLKGREVRFYYQTFNSVAEMWKPAGPPQLFITRFSAGISTEFNGVKGRSITLTANSFADQRNNSRRIILNTEGHKQILGGVANPSLNAMPETDFQTEKLFQ